MSPKKMGRRPIAKEARRDAVVQVTLSKAELRQIAAIAQQEGRALSAWARGVLLKAMKNNGAPV